MIDPNAQPKINSKIHFGAKEITYPDHENCKICNPETPNCFKSLYQRLTFTKRKDNTVNSTNYTYLNFLPIALYQQLKRKANIYFIVLFIISTTKYSSRNPFFSLLPIVTVMMVSIIKEAVEFSTKTKDDKTENHAKNRIFDYKENRWVTMKREEISVGDIILLKKNEEIPADVVVVETSVSNGLCSINTVNIDGETNLKIKRSIEKLSFFDFDGDDVEKPSFKQHLNGFIESEPPNPRMSSNSWRGVLYSSPSDQQPNPLEVVLDMTQFLLRGCILANTEWIICVAIFTGENTKLQQQGRKSNRIKISSNEKKVENVIYLILFFQVILIVIGCILNYFFYRNNQIWYFDEIVPTKVEYFLYTISVLSILDSSIPISLFVCIEVSKVIQAFNITNDKNMVDKETKTNARARCSNLTDELGQVDIVFCDKTGTLTQNKMVFARCSIDGEVFEMNTQDENSRNKGMIQKLSVNDKTVDGFLTLLAVCQSAIPDYPDCKEKHKHSDSCSKIVFQAESPDEQSLLKCAKNHGYVFREREYETIEMFGTLLNIDVLEIEIGGQIFRFKIYKTFEFDSDRKRMSVLAEDQRDGKIRMYTKGAESEIYKIVSQDSKKNKLKTTNKSIQKFSSMGLRSLACSTREVSKEEFEKFMVQYLELKKQIPLDEEKLEKLDALLENEMDLIGATGVEDRLQDKVPETLRMLSEAGVAVWILTGDKIQTALNIVKSCSILTPEMHYFPNMVVLDIGESIPDSEAFSKAVSFIKKTWKYLQEKPVNSSDQAFAINGKALETLFPVSVSKKEKQNDEMRKYQELLMDILLKCRVVICCRVSPSQKSQVVSLYRKRCTSSVTLAIGDGANDVPMIKAAHVGVGIEDREGKQASRNADFSISQFKDLKSLMLYHGALNYSRICKLINFSFYKNMCFVVVIYCYIFFNGFSKSIVLPQDAISLHNLIFSQVQIFCVSIFDITYSRKMSYNFPFLYQRGPRNQLLNIRTIVKYIIRAVSQGILVIFIHYVFMQEDFLGKNGFGLPECFLSYSLFNSILTVVAIEAILHSEKFNYYSFLAILYTTPCWMLFKYASTYIKTLSTENYECAPSYLQEPFPYFMLFFCITVCCLPHIIFRFFKNYNVPDNIILANELECIKGPKKFKKWPKLFSDSKPEKKVMGIDSTCGDNDYYQKKKSSLRWADFIRSKIQGRK